jgi:hypothetical protein
LIAVVTAGNGGWMDPPEPIHVRSGVGLVTVPKENKP